MHYAPNVPYGNINNNFSNPMALPIQILDVPQPPPSYDYEIPAHVIQIGITPCCHAQYEVSSLHNYVGRVQRCPNGHPLTNDRVHVVYQPVRPGIVRTVHHEVAGPRFSLMSKLWNGVKAVARFVRDVTIEAAKILWIITKIALKIIAYTALTIAVAAVILNPTPIGIIAIGAIALLLTANDRKRRCDCF